MLDDSLQVLTETEETTNKTAAELHRQHDVLNRASDYVCFI